MVRCVSPAGLFFSSAMAATIEALAARTFGVIGMNKCRVEYGVFELCDVGRAMKGRASAFSEGA